jgi:phosphopantothenoylcysteine synthetase/decarboxylase
MRPVLITGGATRNRVDAIRYLSAFASGTTAVTVATALRASSHDTPIHLLGSQEALLRAPADFDHEEFFGTVDLLQRMERWVGNNRGGVVVHSAAVGDYEITPQASGPAKIPSGQAEVLLRLVPAPKILDRIRGWDRDVRLVSFKAASPETSRAGLVEIASAQLERSRSDLVFANVIGQTSTNVLLVSRHSVEHFDRRDEAVAALVDWVEAAQHN